MKLNLLFCIVFFLVANVAKSQTDLVLLDFDNIIADGTIWSAGGFNSTTSEVVDNLVLDGINTSEKAFKWAKDGTAGVYGSAYFEKKGDTVSVEGYDAISFMIMGDKAVEKLKISFWDKGWSPVLAAYGYSDYNTLDIPANTWTRITIPLDSIKLSKPYFAVLGIAAGDGETEVTNYYFDDIKLVKTPSISNSLLIDFDNIIADGTIWSSGGNASSTSEVVDNLVLDGINTSEKAFRWAKDGTTEIYGFTYFEKKGDTVSVVGYDAISFMVMGDMAVKKLSISFWDKGWSGVLGSFAYYALDIPANTWTKITIPLDDIKLLKPYFAVMGISPGVGETEVTNYYFDDFKLEKNSSTTSISKFYKSVVSVFPNPVNSVLSIRNIEKYTSIEIIDMAGRIMLKQTSNTDPLVKINVSQLRNGLYFVRLSGLSGVEVKKIIKE